MSMVSHGLMVLGTSGPLTEEAQTAKEQVGIQKLKVETDPSEGLVRCNGRLSSTDYDVFCMKSMAGELRWLASRDQAQEKMILAEARRLEDKYYTKVQKKLINEQEVKQIDKDETRELQFMVDQYLWEESWGDCPMEELLMNVVMDQLVEEDRDGRKENDDTETVEELRLLRKRRKRGKPKYRANFNNKIDLIPTSSGFKRHENDVVEEWTSKPGTMGNMRDEIVPTGPRRR